MDPERRAFYQYHSSLMEPWDGPADISFTDGKRIGAVLDRNGLRPGRYYVTKDDLVVMASEAGVLEFPPENIVRKGRLQPGRMFLVDTELGRIVEDEEIKAQVINERPYAEWLKQHLVHLKDLPPAPELPVPEPVTLAKRQVSFGYTRRPASQAPMARDGNEGVGSWATTRPRGAVEQVRCSTTTQQLSRRSRNPPIECIPRKSSRVGGWWARGNLLIRVRRLPRVRVGGQCSRTRVREDPRSHGPPQGGTLPACSADRVTLSSDGEIRAEAKRLIEEDEVNSSLSDRGVNKD